MIFSEQLSRIFLCKNSLFPWQMQKFRDLCIKCKHKGAYNYFLDSGKIFLLTTFVYSACF